MSIGWSLRSRRSPGPLRTSGAPRSTPVSPRCSAKSRRCGTAACCCCTAGPGATAFFRGAYLETDYASFAAWRPGAGRPAAVHDCFGAAAILARRRRIPAWRHGPAHRQCRPHLFSLRHARSRRHRRTAASISISACGASSRKKPGSTSPNSPPSRAGPRVFDGALIAHIKVLRSRDSAASLARAHSRASGARAAAGACRHPHRARPGRFRSRDAALRHRVSGAAAVRRSR